MTDVNFNAGEPSSLNSEVIDQQGNKLEEWKVDDYGHVMRVYYPPTEVKKDEMETSVDEQNEERRVFLNIGKDYDASAFPENIEVNKTTYKRDDKARLMGGQWISGVDRRRIVPVPGKVNMSLRKWNGLSARTRDQISSMFSEMDKETLDDISQRSPNEWNEIAVGFLTPQKRLAEHFLTSRPRGDFDPSDLMSYMAELDNLGLADGGSDFSPKKKERSKAFETRIAAWNKSRDKQMNNPSYALLTAPRLDMDEIEEWADAASLGVASSLRQSSEALELSMNDQIPDNLFDRIVRRHLTEQEPPFSSFDDFEFAVDVVKSRFGYKTSLESSIDDGDISGAQEDMILSGKLIELMELDDMAAIEPKVRKTASDIMAILNIHTDVPEEIPNDKNSPDFRPYIASPKA